MADADGALGLTIVRIVAAPRELVWREWVEPERFADWFGGRECDVPLSSVTMDVREGGALRLTMLCGPGRREICWRGDYREVVPPERLVFTISDGPGEEFELVTVVLTELDGGRTEMLLKQRGRMTPEAYERAGQGWSGFFDRMAERLAAGDGGF
jgi:uncharacterized protein YndB with AHSA1/START domain